MISVAMVLMGFLAGVDVACWICRSVRERHSPQLQVSGVVSDKPCTLGSSPPLTEVSRALRARNAEKDKKSRKTQKSEKSARP